MTVQNRIYVEIKGTVLLQGYAEIEEAMSLTRRAYTEIEKAICV
jgi:hypothetical protein